MPLSFDDLPMAGEAPAREAAVSPPRLSFDDLPEAKPRPAPEMPGPLTALSQGVGASIGNLYESGRAFEGRASTAAVDTSPAAQPLEWSDITSPYSKGLPKIAYGLGKSAPTLAAGVAGGAAGSVLGPEGTIIGGALGAGIGAGFQAVGPYFKDELSKSPNDPNGAWDRALHRAEISGAFSAAGWAAFPIRFFQGPLKQFAMQAFGIQPGISMAEQAAQNVTQGRPVGEDVLQAGAQGAVGAAIPAAGHAILGKLLASRPDINAQRASDPILSRLAPVDEDGLGIRWPTRQDFNRIYTSVKDDLNPIREARNYAADGTPLPAAEDPYVLARLTRGSAGKAAHFIDHGTFDPVTGQNIGPGLRQVLEPVADSLEDFNKYMLARRAVELDKRGIQTGIPIQEARQTVAQNRQFEQPFQGWVRYHQDLLKYMVKSGVIGRDQAQLMMDANKDYVPFYRLMEEPETFFGAPGSGLRVRNPIRGISGSERQILDPIESTIKNTFLFVSLADRNLALRALQDLTARSPRGNEIMQRIRPVRPVTVTPEETVRAMRKQGVTFNGDPDEFTIFRPNAFRPAPNEIAVFNDGVRSRYRVDPYLGSAVNGLDRESIGMLAKILSYPAKVLRAGATLSPEFIARNPIRDQFSAFVFSTLGRGYVPFYDFAKGLGSVLRQDEGYQNWLKSGGANSALVSIDRNYMENLIRSLKDPSVMGTVKNVVRSPLDLLRAASELMENATRVGENKRMLARGATMPEAGFASREVTLDFQRIGSKMRAVNSAIAFFNAQFEGVDRAIRSMAEQPFGFAAKVGAAITLPSIALWYANKDDPRMQEIPRWEKDLFWIVPTDNWQPISAREAARAPKGYTRQLDDGSWQINKGNIWRIPKPFELGVLFGSVPERILDAYYQKDPHAFKGVLGSLQQAFLPNFVPQVAAPLIEQYSNSSLFTGRPLVPGYLKDVLPQYQSTPYTSDTATLIGKFLAKIPGVADSSIAGVTSPVIVENYIRSWTGGLGKHALDLSDGLLRGVGITPTKIQPALTNADKALIKAFAVRFPESGANSIQDFYEEYEKRSKMKKTITYLRKTGEQADALELTRDNVLATAEGLHKALGAQFKMVRDAYRNPKMSPEEKRNFIDMSYLQMIKMAQMGNEVFKRTRDAFESKRNP